jgi:hypothetical protein
LNESQAPNSSRFKTLPIIVDTQVKEDMPMSYIKSPMERMPKSSKSRHAYLDNKNFNALY